MVEQAVDKGGETTDKLDFKTIRGDRGVRTASSSRSSPGGAMRTGSDSLHREPAHLPREIHRVEQGWCALLTSTSSKGRRT